jgi:hypothetical protein
MVFPWGEPWITGTVRVELNLEKPQMLLEIDPRLNWKPARFFIYNGSVEECKRPTDAAVKRVNKSLARIKPY